MNFKTSSEEGTIILYIAQRAMQNKEIRRVTDTLTLSMDITDVHCNGNPLRLSDMLIGDDANFFHDIVGIMNNIDRDSGKLLNFFSPRYSQQL